MRSPFAVLILLCIGTPAAAQVAPAPGQVMPPKQASTPPAKGTMRLSVRIESKARFKPVAYESVRGLIVFKALVAGREVWALLDNGADFSVLDAEVATAANVEFVGGSGFLTTPTGKMPTRKAVGVPFSIAGNLTAVAPFSVADLSAVTKAAGRKIGIIVGNEYFANFALVVDAVARNFFFLPSGVVKASSGDVPIPLVGSKPFLNATIYGKPLVLGLDLGSNGQIVLSRAAWNAVVPADIKVGTSRSTHADGGRSENRRAVLPTVTIGGVDFRNVQVDDGRFIASDKDGSIGIGLLGNSSFLLDTKAGTLWLRQVGPMIVARDTAPQPGTPGSASMLCLQGACFDDL